MNYTESERIVIDFCISLLKELWGENYTEEKANSLILKHFGTLE